MSIRNQAAHLMLGNLVFSIGQGATLLLLIHLTTPAEVGEWGLTLGIVAPIMILGQLSLREVSGSDVARNVADTDYIRWRLGGMFGAVAVSIAMSVMLGYGHLLFLLAMVALAKAVDGASDIMFGLHQRSRRIWPITVSRVVRGIAVPILIGLGLALDGSAERAAVMMLAGSATILLCVDVPLFRRHSCRGRDVAGEEGERDPAGRRQLLRVAAPLTIGAFLLSLAAALPRVIVEKRMGMNSVGQYTAVVYVVTAGMGVMSAVGFVMLPRFTELWQHSRARAWMLVRQSVLAVTVAGVVAAGCTAASGARALTALFPDEYGGLSPELTLFVVVGTVGMVSSVLTRAAIGARAVGLVVIVFSASSAVVGGVSWVLVGHMGLAGAILGLGCGYLVEVAALFFGLRRMEA